MTTREPSEEVRIKKVHERLRAKPMREVMDFIRKKLAFNEDIKSHLRYIDRDEEGDSCEFNQKFRDEHLRFDMSGYEEYTGDCTKNNMALVNKFAYIGIYDYTDYLFLDFYKGQGNVYYRYFGEDEAQEHEVGGVGTVEIIYEIFQLTIFSSRKPRRRY